MSAFVVSTGTMDRLLYGYSQGTMGYKTPSNEKLTEMGKRFFKLNTQAFNYRYNDRVHSPKYKYRLTSSLPKREFMQALVDGYKAGTCLSYQCCEGKFDSTVTYRELQKVIAVIAYAIVSHLPEYEQSKWD